ncbi:hypothetical protein DPMN_087934 [Dreissena polymorpha]|uniref:Uncharacterized protein n=1 Tax=Dreissena polymorpha TaxID=45954 RepID=A0A9D4KUY8_DREPO|nr:hypothetical protein DPMN_087934 [Dreissena polymorpha]
MVRHITRDRCDDVDAFNNVWSLCSNDMVEVLSTKHHMTSDSSNVEDTSQYTVSHRSDGTSHDMDLTVPMVHDMDCTVPMVHHMTWDLTMPMVHHMTWIAQFRWYIT